MLLEKHKKMLFKAELVAVVILIFAIPLMLLKPSVTGYVSSSTFSQPINFTLTKSQSLTLSSQSGPLHLSSFLLSGEIAGDGAVAIYLSNPEGKKVLVYTNTLIKNKRPNLITGYSVGTAHAAETSEKGNITLAIDYGETLQWTDLGPPTSNGPFTSVCIDSCFLDSKEFAGENFKLLAYIQPGTTLKITEIFFTLG